jgi:hypothetical protein
MYLRKQKKRDCASCGNGSPLLAGRQLASCADHHTQTEQRTAQLARTTDDVNALWLLADCKPDEIAFVAVDEEQCEGHGNQTNLQQHTQRTRKLR